MEAVRQPGGGERRGDLPHFALEAPSLGADRGGRTLAALAQTRLRDAPFLQQRRADALPRRQGADGEQERRRTLGVRGIAHLERRCGAGHRASFQRRPGEPSRHPLRMAPRKVEAGLPCPPSGRPDDAAIDASGTHDAVDAGSGGGRHGVGIDVQAGEALGRHRFRDGHGGMRRTYRQDGIHFSQCAGERVGRRKVRRECPLRGLGAASGRQPPNRMAIAAQRSAHGGAHRPRMQQQDAFGHRR